MKFKRILLPLAAMLLSACWPFGKSPLEIPNVDVESLQVNLPTLPTRNTGAIKADGDNDVIDLYELSDFHGAVNYEQHTDYDYIGLPKLANFFDKKRTENPGGTLLLSSGDMFQGSADSNLTRGYMVNYSMQYMGFDAMAIGNHEFDWTDAWLKKNAELKYNTSAPGIPFLGANITKNGARPDFIKKSTVVTRGDYKIGIIGVIGGDLEYSILKTAIAEYDFSKYADIVTAESVRLRTEEACNAVVLLCHDDVTKIEVLSGVDAVFGGHKHVDSDNGTVAVGVPAAATKNYGTSVAHIQLKFDRTSKELVERCPSEVIKMKPIASTLSDDAGITAIMNEYAPEINKIKEIKLGKCDDKLEFDKALKNLCTKTMFESATKFIEDYPALNINKDKLVAALTNHKGGIRDDIQKGDITYGAVYRSFPFDNELVIFEIDGATLKEKIGKVSQFGIYRTFESKSDIVASEKYYICTTDYLALTEEFGTLKVLQDEDLVRTGKILRDEIAYKVYDIDNIKNEEWSRSDYHTRPVTY